MYQTNDVDCIVDFEAILEAEGMGEDVFDQEDIELVSLSGRNTDQIHSLCKNYSDESEHDAGF